MSFFPLVINEARLQLVEMRQYWFETVCGLVVICATFVGLFYGMKTFVLDGQQDSSLDGLLFGFLMWSFASQAYNSITRSIIEDTQKGYIEQLFLCPRGFISVMFARVVVELISSIIFVTILAYVTMLLTNNWLDINFLHFYAILLVAAPSLVGLGLLVSGLALVFKRVETIGALFMFAFMGLVALEALPFNMFALLPFTPGSSFARDIVLEGAAFNLFHLFIVMGNAAVYLFIGLTSFSVLEKIAKKRNLIGQY